MQNRKEIAQEIELVLSLKMLSQAYEEISVMNMQKTRNSVIRTRDFILELQEVFKDVRSSYKKEIEKLAKGKKNSLEFSTLAKNDKSVSVFISANNKLYGNIIHKVLSLFIENIRKTSSDIFIVGRLGKELFQERMPKTPFEYFDLPEQDVDVKYLKPLVERLIAYKNVYVFYGKFINVANQVPVLSDIVGENQEETQDKSKYLFEPGIEDILKFFESQIFMSFFKQTLHEGNLAKLASRIMAMEAALSNIDSELGVLNKESRRLKHRIDNTRQIEKIAGMSLWGGTNG